MYHRRQLLPDLLTTHDTRASRMYTHKTIYCEQAVRQAILSNLLCADAWSEMESCVRPAMRNRDLGSSMPYTARYTLRAWRKPCFVFISVITLAPARQTSSLHHHLFVLSHSTLPNARYDSSSSSLPLHTHTYTCTHIHTTRIHTVRSGVHAIRLF